ncbi:deoxyguanosinetriphosphate triphosphohydrolase, partial [Alphaproteobacteria bacterium]|nr:deoxyguanosinetriphosphate triphosphohydrolase [Alphaproteobacteria bacterium]
MNRCNVTANIEHRTLAVYACHGPASRGRFLNEQGHQSLTSRTPFQHDRDRIIHSGAFRRLKHKTQVFVYHEGDYFRTRLTHSLEVAQIARSMARALGLNDDLAEAVALAHDLGHTPFGHAGEDALDRLMADHGGFDHNEQTVRVLTQLEQRYAGFDGLNLSWETLEGVVKHHGAIKDRTVLRPAIIAIDKNMDLQLERHSSAEAQLANLADDIAYLSHDFDDALRAGLFSIDDIRRLPQVGKALLDIEKNHGNLELGRITHELVRRLISVFVEDMLGVSTGNLAELQAKHADDIRNHKTPVIGFSLGMAADLESLRGFLFKNMWRHYKVNRMTSKAKRVVTDLFDLFMSEPNTLPSDWQFSGEKALSDMTNNDRA